MGKRTFRTRGGIGGSIFSQITAPAGQDIAQRDLCFLANAQSKSYITQYQHDGGDIIGASNDWRGQTFTTDADASTIKSIFFQMDRDFGNADLITFSIRATTGGLPTGPALATVTVATTDLPNNQGPLQLDFDFPCSPSTVYAVVMDFTAVTFGGGQIDIRRQSTSAYSGGQRVTSADGVTWATSTTDFSFVIIQGYDEGKIYKMKGVTAGQEATAFVPNTSDVGYAQSTVLSGATATITTEGFVSGFAGLTENAQYWAQPTSGTIGTTQIGYFAGIAISTSEIQISKGKSFGEAVPLDTSGGFVMMPSDGVVMGNLTLDTNASHSVDITENGVHSATFRGSNGSLAQDLIPGEYQFTIWGGSSSTGAQTGFTTVVKSGQWLQFDNIQQGSQQFCAFYPYL